MSKNNSADPNDNRGDTITVTTSPDSQDPSSGWDKGNGGSDGGKGNNKDTDNNWKWVMVSPPDDPNDRQTDEQGHPVITIRGGMVKVYGNIEVGKSSVSANFKLERGGGDSKDTKKPDTVNKTSLPYIGREKPSGHFKFDGNKASGSYFNGNFDYTAEFDENGKVKNLKETSDGGTKKLPSRYWRQKKRLETVTAVLEKDFKLNPENIKTYNITIKEYSYSVILNSLGIVDSVIKNYRENGKAKNIKKQRELLNEYYKSLNLDTDEKRENFVKTMASDIWKSYPNNKKAVDKAEKEALMGAADIITETGEKISEHLGYKYKSIANKIAGDLRNFQGKKLRSLSDALKTLEKITGNPNMKISQADRNVLANAVRHIDTKTLADNFQRLGKAFGMFGNILTAEKLREKASVGFETGNWQPLMLEVEAMVISGYTAGIAISLATSFISSIVSVLAIGALPATLATIAAITLISYLASKIDDKVADEINKTLIPEAH